MLISNDIEQSAREIESPRIYRFGEFQINTIEETLHRNGEKLHLNQRTFHVLRLLIERAGQNITKQEFFDTVWADTFVGDNSLTVAMTGLRKILGDDPKQPKFIENLPRKGYRFISEVKVINDVLPVDQIEKTDQIYLAETAKSHTILQNRKISLIIGAGCLLFLMAVVGTNYRRFANAVAPSQKTSHIESVAVLPFENQNPDTEYLSDGLTESVINNLSGLPNLQVINRNSVFQYKGKFVDSATVGRELNVRTILTGRFIQYGDDLVVSAELTDTGNNKQIWGRRYNRQAADAFGLQEEISRDVSEILSKQLTGEETRRLAKHTTDSPVAFQLYLKGRYHWNKRTQEGFEKAADFLIRRLKKTRPTRWLMSV